MLKKNKNRAVALAFFDRFIKPIVFSLLLVLAVLNIFHLQFPQGVTTTMIVITYAFLALFSLSFYKKHLNVRFSRIFTAFQESLFIASVIPFLVLRNSPSTDPFHAILFYALVFLLIFSGGWILLFNTDKQLIRNSPKKNKFFFLALIIIIITFLCLKIIIPFLFNGSYIDEYTHIFSAQNFLEKGHFAEIYTDEFYQRGSLFTYLLAGIFKIFGPSILHAKLFTGMIGLINCLLLLYLAKKILKQKSIILLLLIYTISPWVIFGHFYIRFYILYEFFILLITIFSLHLYKNIESLNDRKIIINFIVICAINIAQFVLINDAGRFMILLYTSFILSYLYIFKIDNTLFKKSLLQFITSFSRKIKITLISLIYIMGVLAIIVLIKTDTLPFDLNAVIYSTPDDLKYSNYFFNFNLLLSIFFIYCSVKGPKKYRYLYLPCACMVIFNLLLPSSIQNTRSILYLLPLFYLVSTLGAETFLNNKSVFFQGVTYLLIPASLFFAYPKEFIRHPYLPKEVDYIDNTVYTDAKKICDGYRLLVASNPGIAIFFELKPDYYLNTKVTDIEWLKTNPDARLFKPSDDSLYIETYSKIPVLSDIQDLQTFFQQNEKICLIQGGLPYSWLNGDMRTYIKEHFVEIKKEYRFSEEYKQMKLFINQSDQLD